MIYDYHRLQEIRKAVEESDLDEEALQISIKHYETATEKTREFIEERKDELAKNPEQFDQLMNRFAKGIVHWQEVFKKLVDQVPEQVCQSIEQVRERHVEHTQMMMQQVDDPARFTQRIEKAFEKMPVSEGIDDRDFRQANFLGEVRENLPPEAHQQVLRHDQQIQNCIEKRIENISEEQCEQFIENIQENGDHPHFEVLKNLKDHGVIRPEVFEKIQEREENCCGRVEERRGEIINNNRRPPTEMVDRNDDSEINQVEKAKSINNTIPPNGQPMERPKQPIPNRLPADRADFNDDGHIDPIELIRSEKTYRATINQSLNQNSQTINQKLNLDQGTTLDQDFVNLRA